MIRHLALIATSLLIGTVPALAQSHPLSHDSTHKHDRSVHVPLDSAQHAGLHARLIGSWHGTPNSPEGMVRGLDLSLAHDSLHNVTLRMHTDRPLDAGAARNIEVASDGLRWTQELSGVLCKATAALISASGHVPQVMNGRMVCADREITFILRK